jgi:hypothetical protein
VDFGEIFKHEVRATIDDFIEYGHDFALYHVHLRLAISTAG